MDWTKPFQVIHPLQVVQDVTYSCEEMAWYNLKEGERYLMACETTYRIGTFQKFTWIEQYSQWMTTFTHVRTENEYCPECFISGVLPYKYYKLTA